MARKSYFAEEELGLNKSSNEFLHTEMVFLIDKNSHIRGVYNGTIKLEIKRLLEDIANQEFKTVFLSKSVRVVI